MTEFTISIASAADSYETSDPPSMDAPTILKLKREIRAVMGWKEDYGKLTSSSDGAAKRDNPEAKATALIKNCCVAFGGDTDTMDKMLVEFDGLKKDFGWKENNGKPTSTKKGLQKRIEAEVKAENALKKMSL